MSEVSTSFLESKMIGLESWLEAMSVGGVVALIFAIIGVMLLISTIMYVFSSIALYSMAVKLNLEYPWLAWIPMVKLYILGKIVGDKINIGGQEIRDLSVVLIVASMVSGMASQIPYIGILFLLAYYALIYCVYYKLFRIFKPESAVLFLVLSIFIGIIQPFLLFAIRNNEPNMTVFEE